MWLTVRFAMVPKKTIAYATQTAVINRSIGHSSSAYSFDWVQPMGREIAAATITACQPQNTKLASRGANSGACEVRCTTHRLVPISAVVPKAKRSEEHTS